GDFGGEVFFLVDFTAGFAGFCGGSFLSITTTFLPGANARWPWPAGMGIVPEEDRRFALSSFPAACSMYRDRFLRADSNEAASAARGSNSSFLPRPPATSAR